MPAKTKKPKPSQTHKTSQKNPAQDKSIKKRSPSNQTISKKPGKNKEPNPLDKALEILEGYSEGTPPEKMCGCCEK